VATGLALSHLPLPFAPPEGRLTLPLSFRVAQWLTILLGVTFIGFFAWRVADEARLLASALAATEIVLEREQHLGQLDGLAAAAAHELGTPLATIALVARELDRAIPQGSPHSEDIALLRAQVERCRDILSKLTSLGSGYAGPLTTLALGDLIEDIVAPHRAFGVEIDIQLEGQSPEPVCRRNAGVLYGLGNLVENAVDHADTEVRIIARWDEREVVIRIEDDGPGFRSDILPRLGEPYLHRRGRKARHGGLGLGLFIARTLLDRSGAAIRFRNATPPERGARAQVRWSRADFETDRPEAGR
jgi:two-component system sensor histidine kinase RegB